MIPLGETWELNIEIVFGINQVDRGEFLIV